MLVWDGDCGFCRRAVDRIAYQVGDAIDRAPYQDVAARFPDIPPERFDRSVHLIDTDGRVHVGADAILRARAAAGRGRWLRWCYERVPGFALASEWAYVQVAAHRPLASRLARKLVGPDLLPRQFLLTRWLFLRLLGVVTLCAFLSLYVQLDGLFGSRGILPAADWMEWRRGDGFWSTPGLLWLGTSDAFLHGMALAGIALSVLLIADVAPGPCVAALWVLYLSLAHAGSLFLGYQWDTLLLETLVVAMFLAPWRLRPRLARDRPPSLAGVWLARALIFKLMFLSGWVKLHAGDPAWRELTALDVHFQTQPIPTWTAYYAHHLPELVLHAGVVLVFAIELVLPWLVVGPRRPRQVFFAGTVALMVLIAGTGNYGFFNLLTVAIAVMLLDDAAVRRLVPKRWRARTPDPALPPARRVPRAVDAVAWTLAAAVLLAGGARAYRQVAGDRAAFTWITARTGPFLSINNYGLFSDMTHTRPEIVVEGSRDGATWHAYEFRYKAGDPARRPPLLGPHMPRLDWQMWFAALRGCRGAWWFEPFLTRLLEGAPAVRDLLAHDPFGDDPPRYIRSTVYLYRFTELGADDWWQRELVGPFCPTVELVDGRLRAVAAARPSRPPSE